MAKIRLEPAAHVHEDAYWRLHRPCPDFDPGRSRTAARAAGARMAEAHDIRRAHANFFATKDGPNIHEMARACTIAATGRIEGAVPSPFGKSYKGDMRIAARRHGSQRQKVEMHNLIGAGPTNWPTCFPTAHHLHLYGKGEERPGRKMGHIHQIYF